MMTKLHLQQIDHDDITFPLPNMTSYIEKLCTKFSIPMDNLLLHGSKSRNAENDLWNGIVALTQQYTAVQVDGM
jgi:hypothetical protein